jgi:hypothetical protein
MVMSAVSVLVEVEPVKKMDQATQKKVTDYWTPMKVEIGKMGFLDSLLGFDSETVSEKHIKGLAPFTSNENFNKEKLLKINLVAANLAGWVLAM